MRIMLTSLNRHRWVELLSLLGSTIIIYFFFAEHLDPDGRVLLDTGFDGFKNYFTFGYHVKYGSGFCFEGMAFPHGENLIFADAQPAIAIPVSGVCQAFPALCGNIPLLVNCLMFGAIAIGSLFIAKLICHYTESIGYSVLVGIGLAFLSPQIFRMSLHHSLAYVFVIPMLLYLDTWLREKQSNFRLITTGICITVVGFIHAYYLLIYLLYYVGRIFWEIASRRSIDWRTYAPMGAGLLVFVIFMMADSTSGRPDSAWGVLEFRARLKDIFLPFVGPIAQIFKEKYPDLGISYNEGSGYIGVMTLVSILILVLKSMISFGSNEKTYFRAILISIPSILFAMQWPLLYLGEDVLQDIPIISQFRGSGRAIWLSFYLMSIFGSIYLFHFFKRLSKDQYVNYLFVTAVIIFIESFFHIKNRAEVLSQYASPNLFQTNTLVLDVLLEHDISPQEIKAAVILPASTIGTERLSIYDEYHAKLRLWSFSMQTGVPNTSINLSRTSFRTMLDILAFVHNYRYNIPAIYPKGKYLIGINKEDVDAYRFLLDGLPLLGSDHKVNIYLWQYDGSLQEIERRKQNRSQLNENRELILDTTFADLNMRNIGNLQKTREWSLSIDTSDHPVRGCIQYWNNIDRKSPIVQVNLTYVQNEQEVVSSFREDLNTQFQVDGDWLLQIHPINIPNDATDIKCNLQGKNLDIREVNISLYKE